MFLKYNKKKFTEVINRVKFYTVQETAGILKVTPQTIRAYIKRNKLKAQRIGRPLLITDKNLTKTLHYRSWKSRLWKFKKIKIWKQKKQ